MTIDASLTSNHAGVGLKTVDFYYKPIASGSYISAGAAVTSSGGTAVSPELNLPIGPSYDIQSSFIGDAAYQPSSVTQTYTPPGGGNLDSTVISGLTATVLMGGTATPEIVISGTLIDTTLSRPIQGASLEVFANGQAAGATSPTVASGAFSETLVNATPGTTYRIGVTFASTSTQGSTSSTTSVDVPPSGSSPPPPPGSGGLGAIAGVAAVAAVVVLATGGYYLERKKR